MKEDEGKEQNTERERGREEVKGGQTVHQVSDGEKYDPEFSLKD